MDATFMPAQSSGFVVTGAPGAWWLGGLALGGLLVLASWIAMMVFALKAGGPVEKPNRVPQLYGYTVCLIAVVTFLLSVASAVNAVFNLRQPLLQQESWGEPSLTSFDAWRATGERRVTFTPEGTRAAETDTVSADALRARYEALKADRIASVTFRAQRTIATSGILMFIAAALFSTHWFWLRRRATAA